MINKKILTTIILTIAIIIGFSAYFIKEKYYKKISPQNLELVQKNFLDGHNSKNGYSINISNTAGKIKGEYSVKDTAMSGMFYPSTNDLSSVESSKNIQNPGMKISITKDSSYVETNGKYEKTSAFSFESNILSHPEWIHLTEALSETTYKNTRCYQYKIYFEKPNPEISNQISPDLLDKIRLKGKILIDKQNMSIKKIEIFSDKDGGSSTIVEYNPLEIRPKVSIPSVD